MSMTDKVRELWPEIEWIENPELRAQVTKTWCRALELSDLEPDELLTIPFTLLAPDVPSFMAHKRAVVHIARDAGLTMKKFFGSALPIDIDLLVAGAILIDVGKLLEYEKRDGETVTSRTGKYLRHPFTGVALARECGVPDEVCHMIATHAKEGSLGKRSTESWIVHHADFLSFEPFRDRIEP